MRKIALLTLCILSAHITSAQWIVTDWTNFFQSIINSAEQVYEGARTADAMLNNFEETKKIYEQGKEHLDRLKNVSTSVKSYRRVVDCVGIVGEIADKYVTNYNKMLRDENFNFRELNAIGNVYNRILQESGSTLAELELVINNGNFVMSDNERLERINQIHDQLEEYKIMTDAFTRRNIGLSVERSRKKKNTREVIEFYGRGNNQKNY